MTQDPIRNVSDTALWVATYRADETDRRDALFRDPWARRLAGERGAAIVRAVRGRGMAWAMVVRTVVIDRMVMRAVGEWGADTIVNLAAGLDTRPWRLDLPAATRWVDVDLAPMLEYKRAGLAGETPRCRYEALAADLGDPAARHDALARAAAGARRALVISEGLLVYLEAEQAAALARDLTRHAPFEWWLADLISPELMAMLKRRVGPATDRGGATFKFAPAEGTAFFVPHGWREREFVSTFDEAGRIKRDMAFGWFWRFLGQFAPESRRQAVSRFSGIVLFERAGHEGGRSSWETRG